MKCQPARDESDRAYCLPKANMLHSNFRIFICLIMFAFFNAPSVFAQQCPANAHVTSVTQEGNKKTINCKCNDGFEPSGGACKPIAGNPQCVQLAGEKLKRDQQQGCASVVGKCFANNKTPLSTAAVGCVTACAKLAGCAIGCGISALAVEDVVARCVDERNSCFEAALARHKQAIQACK
jgi:hypothetical protein